MNRELVGLLRSPRTGAPLALRGEVEVNGRVQSGDLVTPDGTERYPVVNFVPRFVPSENYAKGFGMQWNRFRRTQLDSYTGLPISRDRFYDYTSWTSAELAGKRVLDVGCGAGRFAEVALAAGARVVALDYSSAVDACWANHMSNPGIDVVQGNIYELPFAPGSFDYIYCIGVLQHTPDVRRAFLALPPMLRAGGALAVGIYAQVLLNWLWPKYWLRPLTRRVPPERLFPVVERAVPILLPVSRLLSRTPRIGRWLRWTIPVANHELEWPLTPELVEEWAVLDTFDMFAPRYDQPQTAETLRGWFQEADLRDVWVGRKGFLVGRGRAA